MSSCKAIIEGSPYISYCYSYPHKTAYRHFEKPIPLRELWKPEKRDALFLYIHIPFCESRCGFCNLMSLARPPADLQNRYIETLKREAHALQDSIFPAKFSRMAFGGGTPSHLSLDQLNSVLYDVSNILNISLERIPCSFEVSPATLTDEKAAILSHAGIDRISIGIQSFNDEEVKKLGRHQSRQIVERSLDLIRKHPFKTLNMDLIYGGENQDIKSWQESLKSALIWKPEELYLYPLYVRPETSLGKKNKIWTDNRLQAYRIARDFLLSNGYVQKSQRLFCLKDFSDSMLPEYVCQTDGMIGLGCGARSYTEKVHYSSPYAVDRASVQGIISQYTAKETSEFCYADYGYELDMEDRLRRYTIKTLLRTQGICRSDFFHQFKIDLLDAVPQVPQLLQCGLAIIEGDSITLTEQGLERSDAIGPWLFSKQVANSMESFTC